MSARRAIEKANEVNELSLNYHLSHATFACNVLLEKEMERILSEELKELSEKIKIAYKEENREECKALMGKNFKARSTYNKLQIYVGYLKTPKETGFTVREKDQLVVYLPKELLDKSRSKNKYTARQLALNSKGAPL